MGIRVHKVLGYGLTDVKKDDPRVNWDSALLSYDKLCGLDYQRWLEGKYARRGEFGAAFSYDLVMLRHNPGLLRVNLSSHVIYDCEYGMENVLVIVPLGLGGWLRYDDDIDYMAETYLAGEPQVSRVDVFRHGIHPFNGVYMDSRSGVRLGNDVMHWVRLRSGLWSGESCTREEMDELTRELTPFASYEEANENVAPWVPGEVRDIAEYGSLFTGETVQAQLRPVLYTYWG